MYLAIDVGGTKTLVAAMSDDGQILQEVRFASPKQYDQFLTELKDRLTEFHETEFKAAAIALPGSLDRSVGAFKILPNLGWKSSPIQKELCQLIGCPIAIENDAKAGGLGEAMLLADEFERVLYLTLGTGIGYAYIVNSIIEPTPDEGGFIINVTKDGKTVGWESLSSGRAIVSRFGQTATDLTDQAKWQEFVDDLVLGLNQLLDHLSPEVIVIGGGVATSFERFGPLLQASLKQTNPSAPVVRQAARPDQAVVYGCYQLARQLQAREEATHGQTTS